MKCFIGVVILIASVLGGCATAPLTAKQQALCGPGPTDDQVASAVRIYLSNVNWKDPESVQVRNVRLQGCQSQWNGLINGGGHTIGWQIDLEVNAKNSYGGYTGFEERFFIRTADGVVHW